MATWIAAAIKRKIRIVTIAFTIYVLPHLGHDVVIILISFPHEHILRWPAIFLILILNDLCAANVLLNMQPDQAVLPGRNQSITSGHDDASSMDGVFDQRLRGPYNSPRRKTTRVVFLY